MTDHLCHAARAELMGRIKGRNTAPEKIVRQLVSAEGLKYRLHRRDLPGSPDLVLSGRRKLIFVHGCYWHRHSCRKGRSVPSTNTDVWAAKFQQNIRRDRSVRDKLKRLGWSLLVVWECQTRAPQRNRLAARVHRFLMRA